MKKHDYVEIIKGRYKGARGFVDSLPTPKTAYVLTSGLLHVKCPLASLQLVPDDDEAPTLGPLPF